MIEIRNSHLIAGINPLGAELQSLQVRHNGHELIWQRDPEIWAGSAPILFPIVGRLLKGQYALDGQTYRMPNHGIVRGRTWHVVEHDEAHVTLAIGDSDESRVCYPFRWMLEVRFELTDLQLTVTYRVVNRDTRTLYFSIGSHPGFNLNFGSDRIADYFLRTDNPGPAWQRHKILGQVLSKERFDLPWKGPDLQLSDSIFNEDALIFVGVGCKQLSLCHAHDPRQIIFDTGGAPDLGIWAKRGAPYVCFEPWFGYDDLEGHDQQLPTKPGIQTLESQCVFGTAYSIRLNPAWLGETNASLHSG
jgi:galactose mutarotase-like enzyme